MKKILSLLLTLLAMDKVVLRYLLIDLQRERFLDGGTLLTDGVVKWICQAFNTILHLLRIIISADPTVDISQFPLMVLQI